jgi:hypothetical protein
MKSHAIDGCAAIAVTPYNFLRENGQGFAISFMLRREQDSGIGNTCLVSAYDMNWGSLGIGLEIHMKNKTNLFIRGGSPDRNTLNSYDSNISSWQFKLHRWFHLTFVFFPDREEVYVDGKQIWRKDIARRFMIRNQSTYDMFTIGDQAYMIDDGGAGGLAFAGLYSELKYWSNVLSPQQVKAEAERCLAMVES